MSGREQRESTRYLTMGASVGLIGALGAVAGAAVCPVCIVATPALLGVGLYKRWKESVEPEEASSGTTSDGHSES